MSDKHNVAVVLTTGQGMDIVKEALHKDPDYAWTWQCNLACSAMDEGLSRAAANRAASRFLLTAFQLDITQHPNYAETQADEIQVEPGA